MRVCDSAGAEVDREEEERRDVGICHWGNEGLWSSAFNASSCLTNGRGVFRIRGNTLGGAFVNVTPVFFCSHLSSSALFFLHISPVLLTLLRLSGDFSHSLLAPDHRSPIVCLLHHSHACPSSVIIPVPASLPIYSPRCLLSFHLHSHICLRILLFVPCFFSFSGGKADEWLDRAIPLLRGYRFNLRGHGHQQLGVLSKRPWSLGKHRINDLSLSSGGCSLIRSTSWKRRQSLIQTGVH